MATMEKALVPKITLFCSNATKIALTTSRPSLFSCFPTKNSINLCSSNRICCSYDSGNGDTGLSSGLGGPKYPRPREISWKKELSNRVELIGTVAIPVQMKHLASGKVLAWSRLAVKQSQNETLWINLTFWNELAHVASQHVEKGNQIYVVGRLVSDVVDSGEGKQQTFYKIFVQQFNFVERSSAFVSAYDGESNSPTPGRKQNNFSGNQTGSVEELWQAFFANPREWWDNRKTKRTPNYPDFKHKDTGEALWVESRNSPPWVKSQLSILDSRMESFRDYQYANAPENSMSFDNFSLF